MQDNLLKAAVIGLFAVLFAACSSGEVDDDNTPVYKHYVYVVNSGSATVSGYVINTGTGALTPVPGSPFGTGLTPVSIAIDPQAKYAYVANVNTIDISVYRVNAATGALTEVAGSPVATGTYPSRITIDPGGKFAYVTEDVSGCISV